MIDKLMCMYSPGVTEVLYELVPLINFRSILFAVLSTNNNVLLFVRTSLVYKLVIRALLLLKFKTGSNL